MTDDTFHTLESLPRVIHDDATVLFVCAVEDELEEFRRVLQVNGLPYTADVGKSQGLSCPYVYRSFYKGFKIIAFNTGITFFNAAELSIAIQRYQPNQVVGFGTCASMDGSPLYTTIISNNCACAELDLSVFGYSYGSHLREKDDSVGPLMLSGSCFLNSVTYKNSLKKKFPGVVSFDMETYMWKYVCKAMHVPFIVVRSVSDSGDDEAFGSYADRAVQAAYIAASSALILPSRISFGEYSNIITALQNK